MMEVGLCPPMPEGPVRQRPMTVFEDGTDSNLKGDFLPDDRGKPDVHLDPDCIIIGGKRPGQAAEARLFDHADAIPVEMVHIPVAIRSQIDLPVLFRLLDPDEALETGVMPQAVPATARFTGAGDIKTNESPGDQIIQDEDVVPAPGRAGDRRARADGVRERVERLQGKDLHLQAGIGREAARGARTLDRNAFGWSAMEPPAAAHLETMDAPAGDRPPSFLL